LKILLWLPKAAIFFTLFAFALNNQHLVSVYFFFGTNWQAPLVLVVLAAFVCGLGLGVLAMVPRWWHQRRRASTAATGTVPTLTAPLPNTQGTAYLPAANAADAPDGV